MLALNMVHARTQGLEMFLNRQHRYGDRPLTLKAIGIAKELALSFCVRSNERPELFVFLVVSILAQGTLYSPDVDTILQGLRDSGGKAAL